MFKKQRNKFSKDKKGYISVEVIMVVGVIIMLGVFIISRFGNIKNLELIEYEQDKPAIMDIEEDTRELKEDYYVE